MVTEPPAQALTAPANIPGLADQGVPGLQLALATGASVYFLRENKRASLGASCAMQHSIYAQYMTHVCLPDELFTPRLIPVTAGKAAGITAAGFLIGSILGGGLQSWLRVDIVPIGVCSCLCYSLQTMSVPCTYQQSVYLGAPAAAYCLLRVQALSSPGALVGEFAILALYLSCTFLA